MVLRELYTDFFIPSSKKETFENYIYGTIIKYDEEDVSNYVNRYEATLEEYIKYDVKKYTGMKFQDYLDITYGEKDVILETCLRETKRAIEAAEAAKADSEGELNKIKKGMLSKNVTYEGLNKKKSVPVTPITSTSLEEVLNGE